MATLSQTLQNNSTLLRGPNGELSYGPQTTQQLAGQAGLAGTPLTPAGAGMIGATPDQQKMAGTPQQKAASLAQTAGSTHPSVVTPQTGAPTLQETLRTQQVGTQATAGQQALQQKSQALQALGQTGDRVQALIQSKMAAIPGSAGQVQNTVDPNAKNPLNNQPLTADQVAAVQKWAANPSDQNAALAAHQALGDTAGTAKIDPTSFLASGNPAIAAAGQAAAGGNITVRNLVSQPGFGYSMDQLSSLLGVDQATLSGMGVQQLHDKIAELTQQEYNKTAQLQKQATSGLLGGAESALAQQAGKEASATGVRGAEAQMQSLTTKIQNADTVQFNGQTMSVEDLLGNQGISNTLATVLSTAPGSQERQQLQANEPDLYKFMTDHEDALKQAAAQMSGGESSFETTQTANAALASAPFGGNTLSDSIAKAVIPGFGTAQAGAVDPNSVPLLKLANEVGPDQGRAISAALNQYASDPQFVKALSGMSEDQLKQLQIGSTNPDSPWQKNYVIPMQKYQAAQSISSANPDLIVQQLSGGKIATAADIGNYLRESQASKALGFGYSGLENVLRPLGPNPTGDQLKQALLSMNPAPTLGASAPAGPPADPQLDSMQRSILGKINGAMTPAARNTTTIGGATIAAAGLTLPELQYLKDHPPPGTDAAGIDAEISRQQSAAAAAPTSTLSQILSGAGTDEDKLKKLYELESNPQPGADLGSVAKAVGTLQGRIQAVQAASSPAVARAAASKIRGF